ncbi:MAG: hypothetical protein H6704_30555 [Myxococcales bacterium]|nr:hypothetical protein [Myxococcales bacterium]MCB9540582.1 hypothetical protein [Myxococcales bacterium]
MRGLKKCVAVLAIAALPQLASAQDVVQPGDAARKNAEGAAGDRAGEPYYNAYDAPMVVKGHRGLVEEDRIGSYKQPRWTARRRFPTTRVYVRPEGQFAFEYWLRSTADLENFGKANAKKYRSIYEWEFGLGNRLQLDLYLTAEQKGHGPIEIAKESIELRYALADWGEIWANPTLYFEAGRHNAEENFVELKVLLGGEMAPGLHSGLNLVLERVVGGPETHEYKVTGGISKTIVDTQLSIGAEAEVELIDDKDNRFDFIEKKYVVGPSISWQPSKHIHLLLTPLFGIAQEKAGDEEETTFIMQNWLVAGWDY